MIEKKFKPLSKDYWETPSYLFDGLNKEFHFTLDAAANRKNSKCIKFISEEEDALRINWIDCNGGNIFLNPPYSKDAGGLNLWNQKAYEQSQLLNVAVAVVMLGDTSTKYRSFASKYASEIRDLTHRVRFIGAIGTPNWPTSIYIFRPIHNRTIGNAAVSLWTYK